MTTTTPVGIAKTVPSLRLSACVVFILGCFANLHLRAVVKAVGASGDNRIRCFEPGPYLYFFSVANAEFYSSLVSNSIGAHHHDRLRVVLGRQHRR
jgi:hypothetical protein